ncbi:efflux RND transporter permease subunit [Fulvivirgaceae bacterium PWU4]|uniref:Efflux RND transporter permease subunit n=1 Tax=Chryseosolibacter histidini TaxID=2782349 RepID=A0AAP2GQU4_9BACT|nr:efflux RND transporter permease subunit [Chryseosolibacter histidini]MBT1699325.1 efflux RND transporter permease subunit [Chryseosolibacter histidini]
MQDLEGKEFKPTSWAIDNKVAIYVATVIICLMGIITYNSLPKENFPEVVFPQIYVATPYPGAAPEDIENLITKQIEKQVKSISGIKKVTSNSIQDFSNVIIEFEADENVAEAKREVKDAVDRAKPDLPNDLPDDPVVMDIDISEVPIMYVNLSGDYDLQTLKRYAEMMQDRFEGLKEIRRIDIVGALDREIQINVDMYKAALAGVSFDDISQAIGGENVIVPGGQLAVDGTKRSLSVSGEYDNAEQMGNTVVGSIKGGKVYLKDIAEVVDSHKEQESFARLDKKNVVTLNVVKRSGENLINASDNIRAIIKEYEEGVLPPGLKVTVTADQSDNTRVTLHDLINTIIIGFILVTIILMFFMGVTNAIFVGLSVPISSFIAFLVFPGIGFTLNMMTLFSFLLALGIVVDDAIVVIENTHRVFDNGKVPIRKAAKIAAGEVFLPVFSGTMVVLAPFIPLAFWPGVIGKFMMYLPITLIVALLASLVVAYIINPVFAADFMTAHDHDQHDDKERSKVTKGFKVTSVIFAGIAIVSYLIGVGLGNFVVFLYLLYVLHHFLLERVISNFQTSAWPKVQEGYKRVVTWCLYRYRPIWVVVAVIGLFIFSFVFTAIRKPPVVFFPNGDPNFIFAYIRMPIGTDQRVTDSITAIVEDRVIKTMSRDGKRNPIVESVISNVAIGASEDPFEGGQQAMPHLGKVQVAFVKFASRNGESTKKYMDDIREAVKGIKGAEISVNQEANGPPTGKPINIEIAADNFDLLVETADKAKRFLIAQQVPGVEELKSDFQADKPEVKITIDREKANREGISTQQIGFALNAAVYGREVSKFRDDDDDYDINLRIREDQRNDVNTLINLPITYRDMGSGGVVRQVPLSAVAKIDYSNSYAGIRRIDQKRVITLSSNVLGDYNPNEVVADIQRRLESFQAPDGVTIRMTGEQEDQAETGAFLALAFGLAFMLIFMILVTQFNSVSKPVIILSEILFSIIGVLIGFSLFKMEISIIMTGVGIMALAGLVVRNGILLVEFTELLRSQGVPLYEAIIEAARTRMTPVLLTTMAATIGLIPLAVGLNIDFVKLFTELNPHIYFGGDNVAFWGPLSWTMIFGLIFGTFLTLILVPVMYLLTTKLKERIFKKRNQPAPDVDGAVASI